MSGFNDKLNKRAVALRYDVDKNIAPVIVASGIGHIAEKIVEIAGENKVPIYEDTSLTTILTQLELGSEIPEELYKAVLTGSVSDFFPASVSAWSINLLK